MTNAENKTFGCCNCDDKNVCDSCEKLMQETDGPCCCENEFTEILDRIYPGTKNLWNTSQAPATSV